MLYKQLHGLFKVCIFQHLEAVFCCKEHHCICFRQYKKHKSASVLLQYITLWCYSCIKQMDSDVLSRPLYPVTQTERRHPQRLQSGTLFKLITVLKNTPIFWKLVSFYLTGCQSEILFFQFWTYNISLDCKVCKGADPLMFAVNIKTNGNPHHHPWSIGKRLLSSWLPVRSAKDQGGAKVTHTL